MRTLLREKYSSWRVFSAGTCHTRIDDVNISVGDTRKSQTETHVKSCKNGVSSGR